MLWASPAISSRLLFKIIQKNLAVFLQARKKLSRRNLFEIKIYFLCETQRMKKFKVMFSDKMEKTAHKIYFFENGDKINIFLRFRDDILGHFVAFMIRLIGRRIVHWLCDFIFWESDKVRRLIFRLGQSQGPSKTSSKIFPTKNPFLDLFSSVFLSFLSCYIFYLPRKKVFSELGILLSFFVFAQNQNILLLYFYVKIGFCGIFFKENIKWSFIILG